MELRFKKIVILLTAICAVSFCGVLCAAENDASTSAASLPTADVLAMLEERFASLSGNLGKMTTLPKLSGTLSLPSEIQGKIQLPGDGVITKQTTKESTS